MTNNNGSRNQTQKNHRKPPNFDQLSDLPSAILITILSLLPFKTAVATSALSRRWRDLWCQITSIYLPPKTPAFNDYNYFISTVNRIIPRFNSPKIDTFDLSYECFPSADDLRLNLIPWFQPICDRKPEKIKVDFRPNCLGGYFNLPTYLFTTPSLVYLKLYLNFEFSLDVLSLINLPNLKKLRIILGDHNWDLMGLLFKSCPLLEDLKLFMRLVVDDHFIDISSPNLKRLLIRLTPTEEDDVTEYCKISINTPNLEYLTIIDHLAFYEFVTYPSNLQKVVISLFDEEYDLYDRYVMGLFPGISSTRTIILENCGYSLCLLENIISLEGDWLPIFNNLNHLSFCFRFGDEKFPRCLLPNLKVLEVQDIEFHEYLFNFIRYILSKAPVMEKIKLMVFRSIIFSYDVEPGQEKEENEYCKKIFMLPSISNCEIEICGCLVHATHTYNLENGN